MDRIQEIALDVLRGHASADAAAAAVLVAYAVEQLIDEEEKTARLLEIQYFAVQDALLSRLNQRTFPSDESAGSIETRIRKEIDQVRSTYGTVAAEILEERLSNILA